MAAACISCVFSEVITHDLCTIADIFYGYAWYRLPVKQQKLFILPIQRANKALRLTGLGLVDCSLRVFASVSYCRSEGSLYEEDDLN